LSLLTFQEIRDLDVFCQNILNDMIHFAVIVNNQGRVKAEHSNNEYKGNLSEATKEMMFLSLVLEMSMRKNLDGVEHIAFWRKNLLSYNFTLIIFWHCLQIQKKIQ